MKLCLFVFYSPHPSKLKHGAKLCQQNKLGHFAMHTAAFAGAKKAMEVILKAGTIKGKLNHQKLKVLKVQKAFSKAKQHIKLIDSIFFFLFRKVLVLGWT